jgi:hypothetical protein
MVEVDKPDWSHSCCVWWGIQDDSDGNEEEMFVEYDGEVGLGYWDK